MRQLKYAVVVLILTLLIARVASATFSSRILPGELFLYTFEEGQTDDNANQVTDVLELQLLGNIALDRSASVWLPDRPGLQLLGTRSVQPGMSEYSQTGLLNSIKVSRVWSMETWFQPTNVEQVSTVFGIGDWDISAAQAQKPCPADHVSYRFDQSFGTVSSYQAQGTSNTKGCSSQPQFIDSADLTHLVVTYAVNGSVSLFLNGENSPFTLPVVRTWYPYWDPSHRLFLSPNFDDTDPSSTTWRGNLHLISMYNRILTPTEIKTNYDAGLPNAKPQPITRLIKLTGYQDTLSNYSLTLDSTDYDEAGGKAKYLELVSFPRGTLRIRAASGWITLSTSSSVWRIDTPRSDLIDMTYQPPTGESGSSLVSLGFAGRDDFGLGRIGYVTFDIFPVPVPQNVAVRNLLGVISVLKLQASNLNSTVEPPIRPSITTLPNEGQIYQTVDGITPTGVALRVQDLPLLVTNADGLIVFSAADSTLPSNSAGLDCFYSVSFEFSLRMGLGTDGPVSRSPGAVDVAVCNRLSSQSQIIVLTEDQGRVPIKLNGSSALAGETVKLVLSALPSRSARLVGPVANAASAQVALSAVDDLAASATGVANLEYRRALDYSVEVDSPAKSQDSFTFNTQTSTGMVSPSGVVSLTLQSDSVVAGWNSRIANLKARSTAMAAWEFAAALHSLAGSTVIAGAADQSNQQNGGALALAASGKWMSFLPAVHCDGLAGVAAASSVCMESGIVQPLYPSSTTPAPLSSSVHVLEFWLSLSPNSAGVIWGLGDGTSIVPNATTDFLDLARGYDLSLIQQGRNLIFCQISTCMVTVRVELQPYTQVQSSLVNSSASTLASEQYQQVQQEQDRPFTHVVITTTLADGFQRRVMYINGWAEGVVSLTTTSRPGILNRKHKFGTNGWQGGVHFFALTQNELWDDRNVTTAFKTGMPVPRPRCLPREQEQWMEEYVGGDMASIVLDGVREETVNRTLTKSGLDFYITSLPVTGSLGVRVSGSPLSGARAILSSELPFLFTPGSASFSYIPPAGQFSGSRAAAFEWTVCHGERCARNGVQGGAGTVWINIRKVIVPPLALSTTIQLVELAPFKIDLGGTDLDTHPPANSPMEAFVIDSLPGATAAKLFLGTNTATAPDLARPVLSSQLPLRIAAATTTLWIIAVSSDGGMFSFKSEVKGVVSLASAVVTIQVGKHLQVQSGAVQMAYSAIRVPLPMQGSLVQASGADAFLPPVLDVSGLGEQVPASSATLAYTDSCLVLLDDGYAFPPTGGVAHGLDSSWIGSNSAAGVTLYLQRWLLSSTQASAATSAKLVSSTPLLLSGASAARKWSLARSDWWSISALEAPYTRFGLCVSSGVNPLRALNGTKLVTGMAYTNVIGSSATFPASGSVARKAFAVDARLLLWPGVGLTDLSPSPSWPLTTKAVSINEQAQIAPPYRLWERQVFLLTRRPSMVSFISRSSPSVGPGVIEICPPSQDLPCELPDEGVDFLRFHEGSTKEERMQPDSFTFVLASSVSAREVAAVLAPSSSSGSFVQDTTLYFTSDPAEYQITVAPPPVAPSFVLARQDLNAKPVDPYSTESYSFTLKLNVTTATNSTDSYRVRISVNPATGAFGLPSASLEHLQNRITFISGGASLNNVAASFIANGLVALNSAFYEMTFQPLYADLYNIIVTVSVRDSAGVESGDQAQAVVFFHVASDETESGTSSASGPFAFLTGERMIYVWLCLGALVLMCICCVCFRKYRATRKQRESKKRRAEKAARRAEKEDQNADAKDKILGAVLQLAAATAANANTPSRVQAPPSETSSRSVSYAVNPLQSPVALPAAQQPSPYKQKTKSPPAHVGPPVPAKKRKAALPSPVNIHPFPSRTASSSPSPAPSPSVAATAAAVALNDVRLRIRDEPAPSPPSTDDSIPPPPPPEEEGEPVSIGEAVDDEMDDFTVNPLAAAMADGRYPEDDLRPEGTPPPHDFDDDADMCT